MTEFPLLEMDHKAAACLIERCERPLIGLHPAAREATKRWSPDRFAQVGDLLEKHHGGTIVLIGGPAERDLAEQVAQRVTTSYLNLAGQTSLGVLGAVIRRMSVLVTNDSGPAHIAYALGTPTVTVFGGTDTSRWGPPTASQFRAVANRVDCWPCDYWECPVGCKCLGGITVDQVASEAEQIFGTSVRE